MLTTAARIPSISQKVFGLLPAGYGPIGVCRHRGAAASTGRRHRTGEALHGFGRDAAPVEALPRPKVLLFDIDEQPPEECWTVLSGAPRRAGQCSLPTPLRSIFHNLGQEDDSWVDGANLTA